MNAYKSLAFFFATMKCDTIHFCFEIECKESEREQLNNKNVCPQRIKIDFPCKTHLGGCRLEFIYFFLKKQQFIFFLTEMAALLFGRTFNHRISLQKLHTLHSELCSNFFYRYSFIIAAPSLSFFPELFSCFSFFSLIFREMTQVWSHSVFFSGSTQSQHM